MVVLFLFQNVAIKMRLVKLQQFETKLLITSVLFCSRIVRNRRMSGTGVLGGNKA
jgi:hypothetical protein